jgi:hypothetical protein
VIRFSLEDATEKGERYVGYDHFGKREVKREYSPKIFGIVIVRDVEARKKRTSIWIGSRIFAQNAKFDKEDFS